MCWGVEVSLGGIGVCVHHTSHNTSGGFIVCTTHSLQSFYDFMLNKHVYCMIFIEDYI